IGHTHKNLCDFSVCSVPPWFTTCLNPLIRKPFPPIGKPFWSNTLSRNRFSAISFHVLESRTPDVKHQNYQEPTFHFSCQHQLNPHINGKNQTPSSNHHLVVVYPQQLWGDVWRQQVQRNHRCKGSSGCGHPC